MITENKITGKYLTEEIAGATHATAEVTFPNGKTYVAVLSPLTHKKFGHLAQNGWYGKFYNRTRNILEWREGSITKQKEARQLAPETVQLLKEKGYLD